MAIPRPTIKDQKVGSGPIPRNPCLFPQIVGITLPLISLSNYPAHKNHSVFWGSLLLRWPILCGVCISK